MAQAVQDKPKNHYLADLAKIGGNGQSPTLKRLREAGTALFQKAEYPNTRMEEWRHTNIAPIVNTPYRSLLGPTNHGLNASVVKDLFLGQSAWTELVFIDGYFCEGLSRYANLPEGVHAGGLADALRGQHPVVDVHLGKHLADRNAYTALNSAFMQDGTFIHVPANVSVNTPIHVIAVTSARGTDTASHLRNLFVLEEGSEASIVTSYIGLAGETRYFSSIVDEVSLGPNARLNLYKTVQEGLNGHHLATTEVRHDRDSRLKSYVMTISGKIVRNQLCVALDGEGAECSLSGLYLNDADRLIDNTIMITHTQPHCNSRIAYKGILADRSKAVFTGKVYVHPEAQQTDSDQLSNNLLLSSGATVDSKPQLEIYADDVKCTHGTTVGPSPEEIIFYFRSRGMDEPTARGMLTYGFADEIVSTIEIPELRGHLDRYVFERYSPKNR